MASGRTALGGPGLFSPTPSYVLAAGSLALGLHCFLCPRREVARFGLPVPADGRKAATPSRQEQQSEGEGGFLLPLAYLKGTREMSYGLLLAGLEYFSAGSGAITVLAAVLSLNGVADAVVVWRHGRRDEAFGHGFAGFALAAWAGWRTMTARRA